MFKKSGEFDIYFEHTLIQSFQHNYYEGKKNYIPYIPLG